MAQYTDRDENFPDAERVALMAGLKEIHAELKEERFDASGKEAELRYLVNLYTQYVLDDPLLDTYARQLRLRTGFLMLQLLDISREE
ncbi:MAG: hypothetical protein JKY94_17465 [Rhodobacteraceae bacterium]|nr:hypothetical protein [Paracoccaceae bacterium]